MTKVELAIVAPKHNTVQLDSVSPTELVGKLVEAPTGVSLFYRWYSSRFPSDEKRISINDAALTQAATPLPYKLAFGRNVLTFAASDQADEKDLMKANHGGVTGGGDGLSACVVSVLAAAIVDPPATLSIKEATLVAEAPKRGVDELHAEVDRLRYRWTFTDGVVSSTLIGPPLASDKTNASSFVELHFEAGPGSTGRVARHTAPLLHLAPATYTLTLRVQSADNASTFVEDSCEVEIVA